MSSLKLSAAKEGILVREIDERPWGNYEVLEERPGFKVKILEVRPGARLSLQRHSRRGEHRVRDGGGGRSEKRAAVQHRHVHWRRRGGARS